MEQHSVHLTHDATPSLSADRRSWWGLESLSAGEAGHDDDHRIGHRHERACAALRTSAQDSSANTHSTRSHLRFVGCRSPNDISPVAPAVPYRWGRVRLRKRTAIQTHLDIFISNRSFTHCMFAHRCASCDTAGRHRRRTAQKLTAAILTNRSSRVLRRKPASFCQINPGETVER